MQKYYTAVGRFERKGRMGDMTCPRSDYEQITSALLFEDVSYSTAITALQHIIDSRVFQ